MLKKIQKGFTLVEMVIVISIIGVLSAILIPAILNYIHRACRADDKVTARLIGTTIVRLMIEYPEFENNFYSASSMCWNVTIEGKKYKFRNVARADGSKACFQKDRNEVGRDKDKSNKLGGKGWEFVDLNNSASSSITKILNSRLDEIIGGVESMSFIPMRSTGYKHPAIDCNHDKESSNSNATGRKRASSNTYSYTDKWIVGYDAGKDGNQKGQVEVWAGDSYGKGTNGPRVRLWPNPPSYY